MQKIIRRFARWVLNKQPNENVKSALKEKIAEYSLRKEEVTSGK